MRLFLVLSRVCGVVARRGAEPVGRRCVLLCSSGLCLRQGLGWSLDLARMVPGDLSKYFRKSESARQLELTVFSPCWRRA